MSKLTDGLSNVGTSISTQIGQLSTNPVATAVGGAIVGGAIVGTVVAATSSRKKSTSKARRKSSKTTRRKSKRRTTKKRNYKYARTAGKGKDRSTKRIRMTKNGQPYIILKSGKARFIKKSSARASRKKKGGRY